MSNLQPTLNSQLRGPTTIIVYNTGLFYTQILNLKDELEPKFAILNYQKTLLCSFEN